MEDGSIGPCRIVQAAVDDLIVEGVGAHFGDDAPVLLEIDFADGRVQLVAVKAYYGGPIVGQELREIRNRRRAALESEEARVRFSIMWLMPILVFVMGMTLFIRRKIKETS